MSMYLWIDLLTLFFPLVLSFEPRIRFVRSLPAVLASILVTGALFVAWDVVATARGDWWFNARFVLGVRFLGLPLEELLFFVTVPYSCLFIYAVVRSWLPERRLPVRPWMAWSVAALFLTAALVFRMQPYTCTVLAVCGGLLALYALTRFELLTSSHFWIYILVTYAPFALVNYLLTSMPIVQYRPSAIWGIRVTTIPLEDFFYSFAMLSLNAYVFRVAGDWRERRGHMERPA